jgi:hypothetical protein
MPSKMLLFWVNAMKRVVALTLLGISLAPLYAVSQTTQPPTKKTAVTTTSHKPAAKTSSAPPHNSTHVATIARSAHASSTRTIRTRSGRIIHVSKAPPPPSYQLHPDPERYQTIQKALADRGYFKGESNGEWGDDSVDAMRRFQADQKIDDDGKIDSLSLISLGLGPRHDGTTASDPKVPPAPASAMTAPASTPASSSAATPPATTSIAPPQPH